MSKVGFEIFALLEYDEELTFEEVQEIEEELQEKLKEIFAKAGSRQVNILEVADGLQIHLTLPVYTESTFNKMCSQIKNILNEALSFKMLFVDKNNINWESCYITYKGVKKKKFSF